MNSKWIKALNLRPGTINLLEVNVGRRFFDTNLSKMFFDSLPIVIKIKTKINKWYLMKRKSFSAAKGNHKQKKKTSSEWDKIFVNKATDEGLISKIYKELQQPNIKKLHNLIKKWKT